MGENKPQRQPNGLKRDPRRVSVVVPVVPESPGKTKSQSNQGERQGGN